MMNRADRVLMASAMLAAIAVASEPARADDRSACVASYERSQIQRREHKLERAREELRLCSRAACPALVRSDCVTWLDQVEASMPTLLIKAERDGADVASVRVSADDQLMAARLDGNALEIEPGEHVLRFETAGAPTVVTTVVVREGEKGRVVPVRFVGTRAADLPRPVDRAAPAATGAPAGLYVLTAVGVAGLAAFGVLAASGKAEENSLSSSCAPACTTTQIDSVRAKYLGADVSLGIGGVSLFVSALWYLLRPAGSDPEPATHGLALRVAPGRGAIEWRARF